MERKDLQRMSAIMNKVGGEKEKEYIEGYDLFGGGGAWTGVRKTKTRGDKTIVKVKKKGKDWKSTSKVKSSGAIEGDKNPSGKGKYISKYKKVGKGDSGKKIKQKKIFKSKFIDGEEVSTKTK